MNPFFYGILFSCAILLSCSKESVIDRVQEKRDLSMENPSSKAGIPVEEFFVSLEDIEAYIHFKKLAEEDINIRDVTPISGSSGHVLSYAINYDEGWELLKGDKRLPCILAESESGYFDYEGCPEPIKEWIDRELEQIELFMDLPMDSPFLKEREESINENIVFWSAITANSVFLDSLKPKEQTKVGDLEPDPSYPGHWELVAVTNNHKHYSIATGFDLPHWHLDSPYNTYSPLISSSGPNRAPAGCVAVAGAALLPHFHAAFGVPTSIPTSGSVTGYVGGTINQTFGDFSSTAWSQLSYNSGYAALLIGYVGKEVEMEYGINVSTASMDSLVVRVIEPLGITYNYYSYYSSFSQISSSILDGSPVLIRGSQNNNPYNGGHVFLVTNYYKFRRCTMYEYLWVYDVDPEEMMPAAPSYFEYDYTSGDIEEISMNWGLGSNYDSIHFTSAQNWIVNNTYYSNGVRLYTHFSVD